MTDLTESEVIEVGDLNADQWNNYAEAQGWSDGMPLMVPTEDKVSAFVETCRGDNEPFDPMPPRRVVPTRQSVAANAVMAGCKPEYFPVVVSTVRALLKPDYNLHGTLATTHPCAPGVILNGSIRANLEINCGSNCFGQGHRANATIGRAVQLTLLNVGGAKPGVMDRSTQGSPAKYAFCFGENEEESPWEPYHVRRGFAASRWRLARSMRRQFTVMVSASRTFSRSYMKIQLLRSTGCPTRTARTMKRTANRSRSTESII